MLTTTAGLVLLLAVVNSAPVDKEETVSILMPGVQPQKKDTYLCYGKEVTEDVYLTGFQPHAHMQTAHHMLMFGCEAPGLKDESVWNCGEMQASGKDGQANYPKSSPCAGEGMKIIYAWGSDAPQLKLPEGVGFQVGPSTPVKYIVLQVHYKNVDKFLPPNNSTDQSGVSLTYTEQEQPKLAGVYMMGTAGELPPNSVEYFESACAMLEDEVIHPFAFRTHAHTHGVVTSAYRVRDNDWKLIGKQSPQKPQMFYDVADKGMTIGQGDVIAMRCTMVNKDNKTIAIGATQNDEMCNYYLMYYVDNGKLLKDDTCWTDGPPTWYFDNFPGLSDDNVPKDASVAPGSEEVLEKTTRGRVEPDISNDVRSLLMEELEKMIAGQQLESRVYDDNDDDQMTLEDIRNLEEFYNNGYNQYNSDENPYAGYPVVSQDEY